MTEFDMNSKSLCVVRRRVDGKFLRGTKLFTWVKSLSNAKITCPDSIRQYIDSGAMKSRYGVSNIDEIEIVTSIDQI
jgi:hypothetical protein